MPDAARPVKFLISADMEGATGVTWPEDVQPVAGSQWERCRSLFTGDVNAAVAGLCAGGADSVVVNDAHATMRNLLIEQLDQRAVALVGRHKDLSMLEGITDPEVEGVVFVGYHVGAGADGVLAHTYLPNSITEVRVDGRLASEGLLNALVAEEFGVPVVLVTGDDATCVDARTMYAPQAKTVAVKEAVSRYAARCLPPAESAKRIAAAAQEAVALAGRRSSPEQREHRVEVEFDAAHLAAAATFIPGVERVDVRRVAYESASAYAMIRCFKAVTVMALASVEACYG